jgi:hypothetical protein
VKNGSGPLIAGIVVGLALTGLCWLARAFVVPVIDLFTCRAEGWTFSLAWFGVPLLLLGLFLAVRVTAPFRRGLVIGGMIPIAIVLAVTSIGSSTCP